MKQELSIQDAIEIARIYGAKWVSQDDSGVILVHKNKPEQVKDSEGFKWYASSEGIYINTSREIWKDSLIEVHQVDCSKCKNKGVPIPFTSYDLTYCNDCNHGSQEDYFEIKVKE